MSLFTTADIPVKLKNRTVKTVQSMIYVATIQTLNKKMEVNSTMQPYELMQAALDGNADKVREALDSGINPNISDSEGKRPLMLAAYNGHVEVMKMLIKEGAEIDVADKDRRTPLMFASTGPFPDAVKLLIDHGADVNAIDNGEGWTPLMFAAAEGNTEVVKVLLEAGADPSIPAIAWHTVR